MVFIDQTVVNVALPAIQRDLGGGLAAQQWVVDAYLLTLGSLILVGGSLGDLFGEVWIFRIGVVWFGIASVLCAAAWNADTLIAFRGLQGIGGALLTPASLALITTTFSGAERGAAIGTWTAFSGISTVAGPLLGGWLIGVSSWRVIFIINVPIALATIAVTARMQHAETRRPGVRVDVLGAALCVAGLGAVVFGFIEEPRRGLDAAVTGCLAVGCALLAAFVVWERHARQPMVELRLFRRRNFSVTNVETLAVWGGLSAFSFFLPVYLQQIAHYTAFRAGLATFPVTLVLFLLSRYAGRFAMRVGPRLFMGLGPIVAGVSLVFLARLPSDLDYWADLLPPLIGFAVGLAATVAPVTTTVLSDAGPGDAGIASGINNAVARVGGLVAIAAIGIAASGGTAHLTLHGFHVSMVLTAIVICVGGVIGGALVRNT